MAQALLKSAERWRSFALPALVFAAILLQGATLGLTDDEAYYWVLAQRPALGYAFHPPAIGWSVAASQALLGWLLGHHSVLIVRLPAALSGALLAAMGARWASGGTSGAARGAERAERELRAGIAVTAFGGIFALAWMIVPDLPLFVGWTLAFVATWELCFAKRYRHAHLHALAAGSALALLSKYSAVLGGVSALASIWLWAPRERRLKATGALIAGGLAAALPILYWNSQHEWASILYQLRERHGDAQISGIRYLRFWAVELVLMGPGLAMFAVAMVRRALKGKAPSQELFALAWALPGAAVFCLQPLWADFKPHWALIVWWPLALALAAAYARGKAPRLGRAHIAYGLSLIALVWFSCHRPVLTWAMSELKGRRSLDPRLDVTNDLYGWSSLRWLVGSTWGEEALRLPVAGSRYQTAAQAAFAMGEGSRVTLLPRDLKARDEWPELSDVASTQGPEWPKLLAPVIFVGDNRYDAPPEFKDADCGKARTVEALRYGLPAKTIYLWKCEPRPGRP